MGRILRVESSAYFLLAAWILCLPLKWCMAAVIGAAVHELFHLLMIFLNGGSVSRITIGCTGAVIETSPMTPYREAICALAGPLGSLTLMMLARQIPEVALFAAAQGIFNLLPVYPLDGGRILRCLLPGNICQATAYFTWILVLGIGFWGCWNLNLGPACLIPGVFLWIVMVQRNISCKESTIPLQ